MDLKIVARMIAVFAIGAGLTAAITALHDDEDRPDADAPRIERPGGDPARKSELARCRDIGAAALEDISCRKAWAENRRRFFQANKSDRAAQPKPERLGSARSDTNWRAEEPVTTDEENQSQPHVTGEGDEVPAHE